MKRKNYILAVAFTMVSLFAASCNREGRPPAAEAEAEMLPEDIVELRDDQVKLAGIELGSIKMQALGNTIRANGVVTVTPQNIATVCMPMGGFIKSTSLLPGNYVSKGETLAVIENQEFVDMQQSYLEAMNRLSYAKAEYDRHTDLYKDDVYSEKNVQQVEVEYRNLAALVKSLEQKLLMIGIDPEGLTAENISSSVSLRSPISGYLSSVNVNIGKFVSPTEVLFEVVNSDRLYLELTLFEKDAEKAQNGQKVRFSVNNGSREYDAVITQTGKSVGGDKTLRVFADVTGKYENLLPGMYVNASILESGNELPALPADAVVSFDDRNYIFVFVRVKEEDGKPFTEYRMVEVQKGVSSSGYTGVILPEGFDMNASKVVVRGAYNLLSAKKNAGEMAC